MFEWKKKLQLDIPALEDDNWEEVRDAWARELRNSPWEEEGLDELIEELADADDERHVDLVLSEIYDMADASRVWLGVKGMFG